MGSVQEIKSAVQTTGISSIEAMVKKSVKTLGEALPKHMNSERLVRIALTTLRLNPELYKCSGESFLGALFQSAQLGLEPNVEGQAYIIPFNNRRKVGNDWKTTKEAQFQIGYKGYVDLFYRHESAVSLDMQRVHESDLLDFEFGTESYLKHKPALKERGEVIGYYAVAKLSHGATVFKVMAKEECLDHAIKHSKCYDQKTSEFYKGTPWRTNFDAMALKTVLIQLMKLLPKSIELQKAISMDETIKTSVAPEMSQVGDQTVWDEKEGEGVEEAQIVQPSEDSQGEQGIQEAVQEEETVADPIDEGKSPSEALECGECGAVISKKVFDFSVDKHKKALCFNCQKGK